MNRPTFSIVLPTHDRPALLSEAICSVGSQTLNDWELIVVDDASQPKVRHEELSALAGRDVVVIRHEHPKGGAAAKSAGAERAAGKYITFLDDDDLFAPEFLESVLTTFLSNREIEVAFVNVRWFGDRQEAGERAQLKAMADVLSAAGVEGGAEQDLLFPPGRLFFALLRRVPMPFQRFVTTAEQYKKIGGYDSDCLLWDCDWALRASLFSKCALVQRPLYLQRADGQGYSSQSARAIEQTKSLVEIKKRLLKNSELTTKKQRAAVVRSLHKDLLSLSWQLVGDGKITESKKALEEARMHGCTIEWLKMSVSMKIREAGTR